MTDTASVEGAATCEEFSTWLDRVVEEGRQELTRMLAEAHEATRRTLDSPVASQDAHRVAGYDENERPDAATSAPPVEDRECETDSQDRVAPEPECLDEPAPPATPPEVDATVGGPAPTGDEGAAPAYSGSLE